MKKILWFCALTFVLCSVFADDPLTSAEATLKYDLMATSYLFGFAKTEEEAKILYGMITGKSDTLLNVPLALNVVYATSLVPNVSKAFALKKYDDAARKISFSIFSTILITLPAAVGISVLDLSSGGS